MSDTQDTFDPPGPGSWMRLEDHLKGALTAEYRLLHPEASIPGMASYMERYGVLARTLPSSWPTRARRSRCATTTAR